MNPEGYHQLPQAQPPAPAYGNNAQARAMMAAAPKRMPTQTPHQNLTGTNSRTPQVSYAPTAAAPQNYARPVQAVPGPVNTAGQTPVSGPITPGQNIALGQMAPNQTQNTQLTNQQSIIQQPAPQQILAQQPVVSQPAGTPAPTQIVESPLSTQATLLFSELRDSLVIMKDGSFRAVVACQSINFDLMSEQEREGVEYSYQNFLNSLNFSVQILVRSQRVDIGPYIEQLINLRRNNDNMLLGVLMDDYINFIDILAQEANIMDKSFFIVIPYYSSADIERAVQQTKNIFLTLGKNKKQSVTRINRNVYNKAIDELNNRVETVISGLYQIGIHSVRLNTKELGTLFYNFNNPDTAVREPLVDFSKLATTYVKKGGKQ